MSTPPNPHAIPAEWGLTEALLAHPGLSIVPGDAAEVVLEGELRFSADGPEHSAIEDVYSLTIRIPRGYPKRGFPRVFETAGRIPKTYHHLTDGSLCLGSSTSLRIITTRSPSIASFVTEAVIPYLYGRSFFERHNRMPFGELAHGQAGVEQDLREMFKMPAVARIDAVLEVAALRRRTANKLPCPCASGLRLGCCHHIAVNVMRKQLGRSWFEMQAVALLGHPATRSRRRWYRRRKVQAGRST